MAKLRLKKKAEFRASGEKVSSHDLDAMVDTETFSSLGELNTLWMELLNAEGERDLCRLEMKSVERDYFSAK